MISKNDFLKELMEKKGYVVFPKLIDADLIQEANEIINYEMSNQNNKVTHFQGGNKEKIHLQKRVWNLLNKGEVFSKILLNKTLIEYVGAFLGDEFCLGSMAVNCLFPGGPGQEPHVDYPYWDMYKKSSFPYQINYSYPLNCQVTILLDDFTAEKGATAILPASQKWCRYPLPEEHEMFYKNCERMIGKAGDVAVFYGLAWHCAMPNQHPSEQRSAILLQFLPKFIKPMEDQKKGVAKEIVEKGKEVMQQLLGYKFPYPKVLDEDKEKNTEGLLK